MNHWLKEIKEARRFANSAILELYFLGTSSKIDFSQQADLFRELSVPGTERSLSCFVVFNDLSGFDQEISGYRIVDQGTVVFQQEFYFPVKFQDGDTLKIDLSKIKVNKWDLEELISKDYC